MCSMHLAKSKKKVHSLFSLNQTFSCGLRRLIEISPAKQHNISIFAFLSSDNALVLQPFYFPEKTGFPVGGPDDATFYIMETHFDNPHQKSGIYILQI